MRENLLPRGKAQERSFTMWTPLLYEGGSAVEELRDAVARWFSRGERGHALLSIGHEQR